MKFKLIFLFVSLSSIFTFQNSYGQYLKLKPRNTKALGGSAFALSIADSTLTLEKREDIIYLEIKKGNVPNFLRKFKEIRQVSSSVNGDAEIRYYVLPDYFAIGSDEDFFYVPMTPILAQKVANLIKCSLPTKKMVDTIYHHAMIKLVPKPIPPTKAMTTVPVFIAHSDTIKAQLIPYQDLHNSGELTAGNKKDVIIDQKIYTEKTPKVVIYGWHKLDGKAIQPVYNKHTNLWADYSHGIRFVFEKAVIITQGSTRRTKIGDILSGADSYLLSDTGAIDRPFYPILPYQ